MFCPGTTAGIHVRLANHPPPRFAVGTGGSDYWDDHLPGAAGLEYMATAVKELVNRRKQIVCHVEVMTPLPPLSAAPRAPDLSAGSQLVHYKESDNQLNWHQSLLVVTLSSPVPLNPLLLLPPHLLPPAIPTLSHSPAFCYFDLIKPLIRWPPISYTLSQ